VRFQRFAERFLRLGLFLPHLAGTQVFEQRQNHKPEQISGCKCEQKHQREQKQGVMVESHRSSILSVFWMASVLQKSPVSATNYRAKSGCGGLFQQLFQILPREALRASGDLLRRAAGDDLPAAGAALRPEIDDIVRDLDDIKIVLDDEHGIARVDHLDMTAEEALAFFDNLPRIRNKIATLVDVGLGYIKLGQSATTLSGGERSASSRNGAFPKSDGPHVLYPRRADDGPAHGGRAQADRGIAAAGRRGQYRARHRAQS